jgi:hypothetical protein
MGSIAGLGKLKSDRQFTMKVFEKYLRISEPALLSEAYDFWVSVYSPKFRAEPEEDRNLFRTQRNQGQGSGLRGQFNC